MHRIILIAVGGYALVNATYIWAAPQHWYNTIPGVPATGPLNLHFARDVALAFLSSAIALIWAGGKANATAAICGSLWLAFHALFHLWVWANRGFPADLVALTNLTGIQLPAWVSAWAAIKLHKAEGTS